MRQKLYTDPKAPSARTVAWLLVLAAAFLTIISFELGSPL